MVNNDVFVIACYRGWKSVVEDILALMPIRKFDGGVENVSVSAKHLPTELELKLAEVNAVAIDVPGLNSNRKVLIDAHQAHAIRATY